MQETQIAASVKGKYILYGSGGHARVLHDLIVLLGGEVVAYFDAERPYDPDIHPEAALLIAIGNEEIRQRIAQEVKHSFGILVHPQAYVAADVCIGEGTVVLANAVVQANARVGQHVIINANVVVDHDAELRDYVTTYPGCYIAGGAEVPEKLRIEANQVYKKG